MVERPDQGVDGNLVLLDALASLTVAAEKSSRALQKLYEEQRAREAETRELVLYRQRLGEAEVAQHRLETVVYETSQALYGELPDRARRKLAGLSLSEKPKEEQLRAIVEALLESVVDPEAARGLQETVFERVGDHVERHPILRPLRKCFIYRICRHIARELGRSSAYHVTRGAAERGRRLVLSYPLPEPGTMRPIQVHLLDACARSGLDFRSAARAIGVSAGTFVRWVMGDTCPQPLYEDAIARFLREAGVEVTGPLTGKRARSGARRAVLPADELRALRKKAGLTIEKAARLAGVSPDQLSRAERGISVNAAARERLAAILRAGYPCCGEGPLEGGPPPAPAAEAVESGAPEPGQTEAQVQEPCPVSSPKALMEQRLKAGLSPTEAARLVGVSLYELWAGERGLSVYPHVRDRLEAIIRDGYPDPGHERKAG